MPFVSIIMPVRNEADFIARSLDTVLSQDYPSDLIEVIMADGQSDDGTREIIRSLQSTHPRVLIVDNPGKIAPCAMNVAMSVARGEIIIRVDGHCEIARDYVRRCVEHLSGEEADGVGGPLETIGQNYLAQVIACAMSSSFGVGGSAFRTVSDKTMVTDTVPFPAYTRAIIERAGPYDEELVRNQDDEYNYRIRKLGGRLLLASDINSRYYSRSSLRSLARQYFQYGYWKVRVMQKHPRQMRARQFVPLLLVVALLMSAGLWLVTPIGGWALALVASSYIVANILASALTAARRGLKLMPVLPVAFAAMHLSYGLGNILGLIKFRGKWKCQDARVPKQIRTSDAKNP
jgi:glycosyltransferase involved in cell wall biosynthesis